jgi:hypothetical protein
MPAQIADADGIFRHVVHPMSFRGSKYFAPQNMMALRPEATTDGSCVFVTSVAWQKFVPSIALVHAYGCRLAAKQNDRLRADGKFTEEKRRIYCGAYQFEAGDIRALPDVEGLHGLEHADIVHAVELGEVAHADLRIRVNPNAGDVEGLKTAIVDRIWQAAAIGPERHTCTADIDRLPHPFEKLEDAPSGQYTDARSIWLRCSQWLAYLTYQLRSRRAD